MLSETLRLELRPFGVRVIAVEPGSISTPAVDKTLGNLAEVISRLPAEAQQRYGEMIRSVGRRGFEMEKNGSSPEVVATTVHRALTSSHPRIRYAVCGLLEVNARCTVVATTSGDRQSTRLNSSHRSR